MKISKLFHWLYAILMLLPVFALGSAILVNTFNNEAKSEGYDVNYRWDTNEVTSLSDIHEDNIYQFIIDRDFVNYCGAQEDWSLEIYIYKWAGVYNDDVGYYDEILLDKVVGRVDDSVGRVYDEYIYCPYVTGNNGEVYLAYNLYDGSVQNFEFVFYGVVENFDGFTDERLCNFISESTYNVILSVESSDITNVFYKAVEQVQSSPVFSWSYNSFLVAPFQYIMALFGMPSNHIVVELLSYWLAVSIIWLVFDLIMYVPLLAHRWLDKGILE